MTARALRSAQGPAEKSRQIATIKIAVAHALGSSVMSAPIWD
jgi:hypothetical protein